MNEDQPQGHQSFNDSGMDVDIPVSDATTSIQVTADTNVEEPTLPEPQADSEKKDDDACQRPIDSAIQNSDLFGSVAQDRILGLIGALMPPNRQVTYRGFSRRRLPAVYRRLLLPKLPSNLM